MANKLVLILVLFCQIAIAQNNKFESFATEKYESQNHCIRYGNFYLFFGQQGNDTLNVGKGNSLWLVKADSNLVTFESINFATHDTSVNPWSVILLNNYLYVWSIARLKSGINFPCVWVLDSNLSLISTQYFTNCLPSPSANYIHMAVMYSSLDSEFVGNTIIQDPLLVSNDYINNFLFTYKVESQGFKNQLYEKKDTNAIDEFLEGSGIGEYKNYDSTYYFYIRRIDFSAYFAPYGMDISFYDKSLKPVKKIVPELRLKDISPEYFNIKGRIGDYKVIGENVYWVGHSMQITPNPDIDDSSFFFLQKANLESGKYETSQFTKKFSRTSWPNFIVNSRPAINQSIDILNNSFYIGANERFDNYLQGEWISTLVIAKYDTSLNLIWEKQITNKNYYLNGIKALPNGGCLVFGKYKDYDKGALEPEPFLYVLNEFGNFTGVDDSHLQQENTILLYPNPAQTTLSIFGLDVNEQFTINILNLNGQTLIRETNDTNMDISNLALGAYVVLIESKKGTVYKKLIKN